MKRKKKFIMSSISLAMSIAFCIVGVYSAINNRNLQISGKISFTASDLQANVAINEYNPIHTNNEGDPPFTVTKNIIKRMPIINTADKSWATEPGNAHVYQLGTGGNIEVSGAEATSVYAYEIVIENKMEFRPLYATFAIRKDYRPDDQSTGAPKSFPEFLEGFILGVDIYSNPTDYTKISNIMEDTNHTGYDILDKTSKYTTFNVSKDIHTMPGTTRWNGSDYGQEMENKFKMTNESNSYLGRPSDGEIVINLVNADQDYYYYSVMLNIGELLVLTYTYIADVRFAGVATPHDIGLRIDLLSTPPAITLA